MERRELVFSITFVTALSVLLLLLGTSITGFITQTMYCENGVCKNLCRFDSDCERNELCCRKDDVGVCEVLSACEEPYTFQPEADIDFSLDIKSYSLESPAAVGKNQILVLALLVMLALVMGVMYFLHREKKAVRKRKSKKKKHR